MEFNFDNPFLTTRQPLFASNAIATSHPLAVQAGMKMLLKGGNAVDASIAAAAMLTVVEPVSCGLGGDALALVWDGKKLYGLNASGFSPQGWSTEHFRRKYGEDGRGWPNQPSFGWDTVTVPGVVSGWAELHRRFGDLPFADALEPAIEIAERGYIVTPIVAQLWEIASKDVNGQPGFAETFMPYGRSPRCGERFAFRDIARSLKMIAQSKGRSFYEGELAEAILRNCREADGSISRSDLIEYRPEWVDPIDRAYQNYTVHQMPPNSQGIATLIALAIVEMLGFRASSDDVDVQHLQIEAMKWALCDVHSHVSDPRFMRISVDDLLSNDHISDISRQIDMAQASIPSSRLPKSGGTVYISAADQDGMMVSLIQSNYIGFGSGVVIPGTGISLHNRGVGFSLDPLSPNAIGSRKQPFHTIIPAFLSKGGSGVCSFGTTGGDMQPQGQLQTLVRMLDFKEQPQAACDAPRWKINRDFSLSVEKEMPRGIIDGLASRGHRLKVVENPYLEFGGGQFIWRQSDDVGGWYVAASDSRRDGQAAGF